VAFSLKVLAADFAAASSCNDVWIRGYRLAGVSPPATEIIAKLAEGWLVLTGKPFEFMSSPSQGGLISEGDGAASIGFPLGISKMTAEGTWLLVVCVHDDLDLENGARTTKLRADRLAGLAAAVGGRHLIQFLVFENAFDVAAGRRSLSGQLGSFFQVGGELPDPHVLGQMDQAIENLEPMQKRRTRLSLHWHARALGDLGIDAFLSEWFALEILCMTDTDITPIRAALSMALNVPPNQVDARIPIGRLYGLRGRIVHEGHTPPLDALFFDWMSRIYVDVLHTLMGLPGAPTCLADADEGRKALDRALS
jgi:hypothetical protein